jgi:hypothetical protein
VRAPCRAHQSKKSRLSRRDFLRTQTHEVQPS